MINSDNDGVLNVILSSKKYSGVYAPLIERLIREERAKHPKTADVIKAVKKRLHLMHGAYTGNTQKKLDALIAEAVNADVINKISGEILKMHSSTSERAGCIEEFYEFIFKNIKCGAVLDLGCGYNPFSLPFMPEIPGSYHAADIDAKAAESINKYLKLFGPSFKYFCADLVTETPATMADAVFMFKLLPVLESQKPGRGFELIKELDAERFVVTYPLRSLGGKKKGMEVFYPDSFEKCAAKFKFNIIEKKIIRDELIYIAEK